MRISLYQDVIFNIALPILAGNCIYLTCKPFGFQKIVNSYLPDGLWAYALMSTILIIWNRVINVFWIITSFIIFPVFEALQYFHIIPGRGDFWDILIYFIFSFIALVTNKYFISIKQ